MILVLFGTSPYPFNRLAHAIEDYARNSTETLIAQLGNTTYKPQGVQCFDFLNHDQLMQLIDQAEIVITQGGSGSILDSLEKHKKVIAVPRQLRLKECKHDGGGQEELVRKLEKEGKLIGVYDMKDLPGAIKKAYDFQPQGISQNTLAALVFAYVKKVIQ